MHVLSTQQYASLLGIGDGDKVYCWLLHMFSNPVCDRSIPRYPWFMYISQHMYNELFKINDEAVIGNDIKVFCWLLYEFRTTSFRKYQICYGHKANKSVIENVTPPII